MSDVRHRKSRSNFTKTVQNSKISTKKSKSGGEENDEKEADSQNAIAKWLNILVGIVAMLACGYMHANYMATIHENWMWFSNIKVSLFCLFELFSDHLHNVQKI